MQRWRVACQCAGRSHVGHQAEDCIEIYFVIFGPFEHIIDHSFKFDKLLLMFVSIFLTVAVLFAAVLLEVEEALEIAQRVVHCFFCKLSIHLSVAASDDTLSVNGQVSSLGLAGRLRANVFSYKQKLLIED